jgi:hypothetical protein
MTLQSIPSFNSLIETPYMRVWIGDVMFGVTNKFYAHDTTTRAITSVTSLSIKRSASGTVNSYTAVLEYPVTPGSDPNYIDYIISNNPQRKIMFEYGDLSQPAFSYKKEEAIITSVSPSFSLSGSSISYTINAVSSSALAYTLRGNFEADKRRPSTCIIALFNLYLKPLFPGMLNKKSELLSGFIPTNEDKIVDIDGKQDINVLDYLRYLVSLMQNANGDFYSLLFSDTFDETAAGPYFKVINSGTTTTAGLLEIDVGYPGSTPVFNFSISEPTSYALITELQEKVSENTIVNINVFGEPETSSTPSMLISGGQASSQLTAWWKKMTAFPINATLSTRGLIVPALLCQNLKINILFYGQRYHYSGIYMVTGQDDSISSSGYRTTLTLIRVKGE